MESGLEFEQTQEIVNDGKPGVLQFMGYKESKLNNNHNTEQQ